jgi:hypothetical protein
MTSVRTPEPRPAEPQSFPSAPPDEGEWQRRHLLDLDDFSVDELDLLMRNTDVMKEVLSREVPRVPAHADVVRACGEGAGGGCHQHHGDGEQRGQGRVADRHG